MRLKYEHKRVIITLVKREAEAIPGYLKTPNAPRRSRGIGPSPEDAERHSDEMARDEARHGKAFQGLLKRYFGE